MLSDSKPQVSGFLLLFSGMILTENFCFSPELLFGTQINVMTSFCARIHFDSVMDRNSQHTRLRVYLTIYIFVSVYLNWHTIHIFEIRFLKMSFF